MSPLWLLLAGLGLCLLLGGIFGLIGWIKHTNHTFPELLGVTFGATLAWLGFYVFCLLIVCSIAFGVNLVT